MKLKGTYLYVFIKTSNNSAIDFYQQNGFKIVETKEGYYKKIEPADAYVLQKEISFYPWIKVLTVTLACGASKRSISSGLIG